MKDPLSRKILKLINASDRPLSKKEIEQKTGSSEIMVRYRLQDLRLAGLIEGRKYESSGQGLWIWWRKDSFK